MSGWSESERLGMWLSENEHASSKTVRCMRGDGRVLAKICDVEGLSWAWFAGMRGTKASLIAEMEELVGLPTIDGRGDEDLLELIAQIPAAGAVQTPPRALPADAPASLVVSCPGCRFMYEVRYDGESFHVRAFTRDPTLYG